MENHETRQKLQCQLVRYVVLFVAIADEVIRKSGKRMSQTSFYTAYTTRAV